MPTYRSIWGWDGSWEFWGYAPGQATADQVARALNRLGVYRGAASGRQSFWSYPSAYEVGRVRWTAPPWFNVTAAAGYPPDVRELTWGRYYGEGKAWKVGEALRRMGLSGLLTRIEHAPQTGAYA